MRTASLALLLLACSPNGQVTPAEPKETAGSAAPSGAKSSAPAAACASDADCGWDDPCLPTRCIPGGKRRANAACEESAPEPGRCACAAGACKIQPK